MKYTLVAINEYGGLHTALYQSNVLIIINIKKYKLLYKYPWLNLQIIKGA